MNTPYTDDDDDDIEDIHQMKQQNIRLPGLLEENGTRDGFVFKNMGWLRLQQWRTTSSSRFPSSSALQVLGRRPDSPSSAGRFSFSLGVLSFDFPEEPFYT